VVLFAHTNDVVDNDSDTGILPIGGI